MIVFLNIDEVIEIICFYDEFKVELMCCFSLSDKQVEVIFELKLCYFVKFEEMKICGEQEELEKECDYLQQLFGFDCCLKMLIKKEIFQDVEIYGDDCCFFIVE